MASKDHIITVHGIWTAGKWQEEIAKVYDPHFECVSVKYPQYRWLGPLDLISEPAALLGAVIACFIIHFFVHLTIVRGSICTAFLFIAYLLSYLKRTRAFNRVLKQAAPYAQVNRQTHIIAHSLGTYLIGRALSRRHDFQAARIILVGCVLPTHFPWNLLRAVGLGTELKYSAIRNELARKDYVVWAAWVVSPIVRGLGRAGFVGFGQGSGLVHDLSSPIGKCSKCDEKEGLIHNVPSDLGHSDTFVSSGYAETFWLPFLWGIDPAEYADFVRLCNLAASLEREWSAKSRAAGHIDGRLVAIEKQLRSRNWKFTNGSFETFVLDEILSRYPRPGDTAELDRLIASAIRGTWLAVMEAMRARQERDDRQRNGLPRDSGAEEPIAWLNPIFAIRRAVKLL
jgi:pimeloyl-ACP methyl ester carboxylesterase